MGADTAWWLYAAGGYALIAWLNWRFNRYMDVVNFRIKRLEEELNDHINN